MEQITIQVGPEIFAFDSFEQWCAKASRWFKRSGYDSMSTIAIDAKGRICAWGSHFTQAKDENTYPIRIYAIRNDSITI